MRKVEIKIIDKYGFFADIKTEVPKNLAEIVDGVNRMHKDGIFEFKPHLEAPRRGIYTICIDTKGVNDNIINQLKDIAINKGCDVKIDRCYSWLKISNKKETIDNYF